MPLTADEKALLEQNILADGCRNPLVLWGETLLDGHNRYEICTRHGLPFDTVQITLANRAAAVNWIINNQLGRRNITPEQASYLRGLRYEWEKHDHGGPRTSRGHNDHLKTHQRLAQEYKVGERTIRRDAQFTQAVDTLADTLGEEVRLAILNRDTRFTKKDVQALVKEAPATQQEIYELMTTEQAGNVGEAKRHLRQKNAIKTRSQANPRPIQARKYGVILVDPPWEFRVWHKPTGSGRSAASHYPTLPLQDLCQLDLPRLAAENCALFLWAVWPSLPDAFKLIEAWGFTYKTLGFEWWKKSKSGTGWHFGMGNYTRANSEPCLLAVKGRMPVAVRDEPNFMIAPVRQHSQKPDEQYRKIERLYPDVHRLEVFGRHQVEGWDVIGNMIDGRDIREYLSAQDAK